MQLSQQLLYFTWTGTGIKYIDIARSMSAINRKLHRQQGLWTIGGCKYQTDAASEFQISHAIKSWPVRNSLVMGFEFWKKQQARAYAAGNKGLKPKWQDFKVWLNEAHRAGTELLPQDGGPYGASAVVSTAGAEWVKSKLVVMETDHADAGHDELDLKEPMLHILGPDNGMTNIGLVRHYSLVRGYVAEEPITKSGAESSIFTKSSEAIDQTVEEIVEHLTDDNDKPPYDPDHYPGQDTNMVNPVVGAYVQVGPGDANNSISMNGFSAPNGLLQLQASGAGQHHLILYVVGREAY